MKNTSPKHILLDVATSLIYLGGTWLIEFLKVVIFDKSVFDVPLFVPSLAKLILDVSELTLLLYFIGALIRAAGYLYHEFDQFVSKLRSSKTMSMVGQTYRGTESFLREEIDQVITTRLLIAFLTSVSITILAGIVSILMWMCRSDLMILKVCGIVLSIGFFSFIAIVVYSIVKIRRERYMAKQSGYMGMHRMLISFHIGDPQITFEVKFDAIAYVLTVLVIFSLSLLLWWFADPISQFLLVILNIINGIPQFIFNDILNASFAISVPLIVIFLCILVMGTLFQINGKRT